MYLKLTDRLYEIIGHEAHVHHVLFLPPGNGKTSIEGHLTNAFRRTFAEPPMSSQEIRILDSMNIPLRKPHRTMTRCAGNCVFCEMAAHNTKKRWLEVQ